MKDVVNGVMEGVGAALAAALFLAALLAFAAATPDRLSAECEFQRALTEGGGAKVQRYDHARVRK